MDRVVSRSITNCILVAALVLLLIVVTWAQVEGERDSHRPACGSARCRKIKCFLNIDYFGESPYGNGPDNACLIRHPTRPQKSVSVVADFEWGATANRYLGVNSTGSPPQKSAASSFARCDGWLARERGSTNPLHRPGIEPIRLVARDGGLSSLIGDQSDAVPRDCDH